MDTEGKEGTAERVTLLDSSLTGDKNDVASQLATVVKFKLTMAAIMS
jgi:hypothetical protein